MNFAYVKRHSKRIGARGERAAAALLIDEGCKILLRNCHPKRGGELDIVAKDGEYLVFVEVKTRSRTPRSTDTHLAPRKSLRQEQKKRIIRGAHAYLRELGDPRIKYRFDLIEVVMNTFGVESICHTMSAFGESVFVNRRSSYAC